MPNSLISQRALRMVHLEQVDLQKRVLMYTMSSVSRLVIPLAVRILMVDWERGTLQNCSQFQDHRILLHHSRNSPCLAIPESEP